MNAKQMEALNAPPKFTHRAGQMLQVTDGRKPRRSAYLRTIILRFDTDMNAEAKFFYNDPRRQHNMSFDHWLVDKGTAAFVHIAELYTGEKEFDLHTTPLKYIEEVQP